MKLPLPSPGRAAVLGAGVMGAQIAAHLANIGMRVLLLDLPDERSPNVRADSARKELLKSRPSPFYLAGAADRIESGNFRDDLGRLTEVDWVIEAVVERLEIKQALLRQVAAHLSPHAILSTNTSGLSVTAIAADLPEAVRHRFLGTHFFNPPRYQKLLELIPHAGTAPETLAWARTMATRLGKGVVIARDTPNFIGNRIGVFAIACALREWQVHGLSLAEVEALTGPAAARPKSATFRTADLVGLDVLNHVARHLEKIGDEAAPLFKLPQVVGDLVAAGQLGAKSKAGFYRKDGDAILAIDPASMTYQALTEPEWPVLAACKRAATPGARVSLLFNDDGPAGTSFRRMTAALLGYAARRIGEICDDPADIDRAMRWGFAWEIGPFEMWDAIGMEPVCAAIEADGGTLPEWVREHRLAGTGIYSAPGVQPPMPAIDQWPIVEDHRAWCLRDIGDGVALLQFRTKVNTISAAVLDGIHLAIDRIEVDDRWRGLVIGNDGPRFSAGADLSEMAGAVMARQFEPVTAMIARFQATSQRLARAAKPVVLCVHGQVLGGGCEFAMSAGGVVAAAESYVGLVELGVGLIPAGGGCLRFAQRAAARGDQDPVRMLPWLEDAFKCIGMAQVATSAAEAIQLGYLPQHTVVVLDADRRFAAARAEVIRLQAQGWSPVDDDGVLVLGEAAAARFRVMASNLAAAGRITEYEAFLANRLAWVLTGGGITAPAIVPQQFILDLERSVFIELLQQPKTVARISSILQHNKPLRN